MSLVDRLFKRSANTPELVGCWQIVQPPDAAGEPAEADFHDPLEMKVVILDLMCRQQQAAEGWFPSWEQAPERALTLTIPTVFRVPKLIASVPGPRKAKVIRATVHDPISTACPSTLLRTHPDVTVYLDTDSAAELTGEVP